MISDRARIADTIDMMMRSVFIVGALFISWALAFGPSTWHSGPSTNLVRQLGLHWYMWSLLFLLYVILLLSSHTRVYGYFLGFCLYAFYAGSFIEAAFNGHLASVVLLVMSLNAVLQQAVGGARAMIFTSRGRL